MFKKIKSWVYNLFNIDEEMSLDDLKRELKVMNYEAKIISFETFYEDMKCLNFELLTSSNDLFILIDKNNHRSWIVYSEREAYDLFFEQIKLMSNKE